MNRTLSRKGHLQNLKESPPKYLVTTKEKKKESRLYSGKSGPSGKW